MASQLQKRGSAVWFLTEQAYCLMMAQGRETDEFRACREAVEYLAGNDKEAMDDFITQTGGSPGDPGGVAADDYDTEYYPGKDRDLAGALYALLHRGYDPATPEPARAALLKSAGIIASFYGADLDLTA
jgi:hypothetical protein